MILAQIIKLDDDTTAKSIEWTGRVGTLATSRDSHIFKTNSHSVRSDVLFLLQGLTIALREGSDFQNR